MLGREACGEHLRYPPGQPFGALNDAQMVQ